MLNFLQKWVELEVTNDQERFFKSIAALEEAHIPYRQEGQHMNHGTRRAGRVGTLGENTRYSVLYQIFVKKEDLDKARYVIRDKFASEIDR